MLVVPSEFKPVCKLIAPSSSGTGNSLRPRIQVETGFTSLLLRLAQLGDGARRLRRFIVRIEKNVDNRMRSGFRGVKRRERRAPLRQADCHPVLRASIRFWRYRFTIGRLSELSGKITRPSAISADMDSGIKAQTRLGFAENRLPVFGSTKS